MIPLQNTKSLSPLVIASGATSATTTGVIDTLGYDYAIIDTIGDTQTTGMTVCSLLEGTASATVTTAIAAFTSTTGYDLPATNGTTAPIIRFNVDLRKRKRYLKLTVTRGITGILAAHCVLGRGDQTPSANVAGATVTG
jgi:hypothetical protein